jgi:hypothetical protein
MVMLRYCIAARSILKTSEESNHIIFEKIIFVRHEIFTVVTMDITVSWT